jgi:hypothetical protein
LRTSLAVAFLLGVCATLLAVDVFRPAPLQAVRADSSTGAGFVGVAGNAQPGARDILWLIDTRNDTPHLCLYEVKEGRLSLVAARNVKYDFMYDWYPAAKDSQTPSVEQAFKETEQARKDRAKQGGDKKP